MGRGKRPDTTRAPAGNSACSLSSSNGSCGRQGRVASAGGTWLPLAAPPGPVPTLGMAWASHGVSEPQTYHTRSQEHRHIVAVPQAHLQEEEVTPAGKEVWWAWSHHSFQGPAPARQVTEALGTVSRAAKPELEAWRSGVGSEGVQGPWVTFQRSSWWKRTLPTQPALQARSRASPTSQGFSS